MKTSILEETLSGVFSLNKKEYAIKNSSNIACICKNNDLSNLKIKLIKSSKLSLKRQINIEKNINLLE